MRDDLRDRLARRAAARPRSAATKATRRQALRQLGVRAFALQQRDASRSSSSSAASLQSPGSPLCRRTSMRTSRADGLRRASLPDALRACRAPRRRARSRLGELAELDQHLAELGQQRQAPRVVLARAARSRAGTGCAAACMSPRAKARAPGRGEPARRIGADLAAPARRAARARAGSGAPARGGSRGSPRTRARGRARR